MSIIPIHKTRIVAIGTIIYISYLIFNLLIRNYLFDFSKTFIPHLQSNLDHSIFKFYFTTAAHLGSSSIIYYAVAAYLILTTNKLHAYKLIFIVLSARLVTATLKSFFTAPRPFFVEPEITPLEAYSDYGSPSGHSVMASLGYGYAVYQFILYRTQSRKKCTEEAPLMHVHTEEMKSTGTALYTTLMEDISCMSALLISLGILFSICFGRLYIGVHSIDQVFLGIMTGGYMLFLLVTFLDEALDNFFENLKQKTFTNTKTVVKILVGAYLGLTLLPIFIYLYNDSNNPPTADSWTIWYPQICKELMENFEIKCSPSYFTYIKVLTDSGNVVAVPFGILFGLLLSKGSDSNSKMMDSLPKQKYLVKSLIYLVMVFCITWVYGILPSISNYILKYLIIKNFAAFIAMVSVVVGTSYVVHKGELESKSDFKITKMEEEFDEEAGKCGKNVAVTEHVEMQNTRF